MRGEGYDPPFFFPSPPAPAGARASRPRPRRPLRVAVQNQRRKKTDDQKIKHHQTTRNTLTGSRSTAGCLACADGGAGRAAQELSAFAKSAFRSWLHVVCESGWHQRPNSIGGGGARQTSLRRNFISFFFGLPDSPLLAPEAAPGALFKKLRGFFFLVYLQQKMRNSISFGAVGDVLYFDASGIRNDNIDKNDGSDYYEITNVVTNAQDQTGFANFSFDYSGIGRGEVNIDCTFDSCQIKRAAIAPLIFMRIAGVLFRGVQIMHRVASNKKPVFRYTKLNPATPHKTNNRASRSFKRPQTLEFDAYTPVLVDDNGLAELTLEQVLRLYLYGK